MNINLNKDTIGFNIDEVVKSCTDKIKDINLTNLNIIVTGRSGAGKSTLINNVFKDNLAETGVGKPVTTGIQKISKKEIPLTIYDTPGFEMSMEQQNIVKDGILGLIKEGYESEDENKTIHCIWYCINVGTNRIEPNEIEFIKSISESDSDVHVPIIVVLTQASNKSKAAELENVLKSENLPIADSVVLLAEDEIDGDKLIAESYGLDKLVDIMTNCLPDELLDTFHHMQIASLAAKGNHARKVIAIAVAEAFAACLVPVSGADAALLIPIQISMLAKITSIYGIDAEKEMMKCFISYTIGVTGATIIGRTAVGEILKAIPGLGTIAGGAISGATAGAITTALGEAYIKFMEMILKGEINKDDMLSDKGKNIVTDIFNKELNKSKENYA